MSRLVANLAALLAPLAAQAGAAQPFASPAANVVTPSRVGSLGQVTLALALVLAVIFGAAWVLRRMRGFGKPSGAALNVIANLPLGQKERAVLIRCGSTQLLLGVAPGRVSCLHVLAHGIQSGSEQERGSSTDSGADSAVPENKRLDFKSILKRSLGL